VNILATLGRPDPLIHYTNRPTVKVVIKKGTDILILNNGLLPGGGVDHGESDSDAIFRELQEELGVTVKDLNAVGTVIQYRNFLNKKYSINGYTAILDFLGGPTDPQDAGEAQFTQRWLSIEDALEYVSKSIAEAELRPMNNDTHQGKLYNLITTRELLRHQKISGDRHNNEFRHC